MKRVSFWYLFCASILPLELGTIWVLFLTELASIVVLRRPSFLPDHFSHVRPALSVHCDVDPVTGERPCILSPLPCTPLRTAYTRDELRLVQPATLDPSVISRLGHLCIGVNLPRKRSRRGGRRTRKKTPVTSPVSVVSVAPELIVTVPSPDTASSPAPDAVVGLSTFAAAVAVTSPCVPIASPKPVIMQPVPVADASYSRYVTGGPHRDIDGLLHTAVTDGLLHASVTDGLLHAAITDGLRHVSVADGAGHVDGAYACHVVDGLRHVTSANVTPCVTGTLPWYHHGSFIYT